MTNDQFRVLAGLLMEIRDALVPQIVESDECQHPEEKRVSFATPANPDHWVCGVCRYEHGR